jgi:hypothetical protein
MTGIRPCTRDDLPRVAVLYEQVMRSGSTAPPPGLVPFFERTLFDHPWADPEIPSLVYEDADGIGAFLGSHVRRLVFDGTTIRMGCSGQFVSAPAMQKRGAGALLLRRYMAGPQELTITDGPSAAVGRMWERLRGQMVWLNSLSWTFVYRPWSAGSTLLGLNRAAAWRLATRAFGRPADAVFGRLASRRLRVPEPQTRSAPLTAAAMLELFPSVVQGLSLYGDYDRAFVDWLFAELASVASRGQLVKELVSAADGRPLGWYVAYLPVNAIAQVVQVAASPADAEAVLGHLLHHAQTAGVSAVQGRLEPHLFEAVLKYRCRLRGAHPALIHSRLRPDVVSAVFEGKALLTRMEGEWWMSSHIDPLTSPTPHPL